MQTRKRIGLAVLITLVLVLLGILFAPYILANIIQPVALTIWLFLRMFILSIGQKYYWGVLIFLGIYIVLHRISQKTVATEVEKTIDPNDTVRSVEVWRNNIRAFTSSSYERGILKRDLANMLVSLYTSTQESTTYFEVYEPLKGGRIPIPESLRDSQDSLPEPVYTFLFAQEPELPKPVLLKKLEQARRAIRDQIRRWTGQEARAYYQGMDEVLRFMETALEIEKDDQSS